MIFTYSSSNLFIRKQYIRLNSCSFCDFKRTQKMSDNDNSTSFACAIHSFPLRQTVRAFCSTILMRNFNISSLCCYSNIKNYYLSIPFGKILHSACIYSKKRTCVTASAFFTCDNLICEQLIRTYVYSAPLRASTMSILRFLRATKKLTASETPSMSTMLTV